MNIRLALYGNICNCFFQVARGLRAYYGIDAHLYLDMNEGSQGLPESDVPELKKAYPDWIHFAKYENRFTVLMPEASSLIAELKKYDLVMGCGWGIRFLGFVDKPTVIWTSGGDVTINPFGRRFKYQYPLFKDKTMFQIKAFWQRRAIRRVAEIWTQPFRPFIQALRNIPVNHEKISDKYFPVVIDNDLFAETSSTTEKMSELSKEIETQFDFVVFHPSRISIRSDELEIAAGDWKASHLLLEGFAAFIQRHKDARIGLMLIQNELAYDYRFARKRCCDLDIEDHVMWLDPGPAGFFSRREMAQLYTMADVVAVDFGIGWFGVSALEGLSVGRPILNYLDEDVMSKLYPWHPMINVRNPGDIAAALDRLYQDPDYRLEIGKKGREWIRRFHAPQHALKTYAERIEALV